MKFPFAILACSTLFAATMANAETQLLWEATKTTCNANASETQFSGCKPVTEADNITVTPEAVSPTKNDLIKDLSFTTLLTYNSLCAGSSFGYEAKLVYQTAESLLAFNSPAGFVEVTTDYSPTEKFYFTRKSEKSAFVKAGCRISIIGNDTYPKAKSLSILDRYTNKLISSGNALNSALDQLGNLANVNSARDAVVSAANRLATLIEQNDSKISELKEELSSESDEFRIAFINQEIESLESLVTDDKARLERLNTATDNLSVKCTENTEECKSVIDETKKTLQASLKDTTDALIDIKTWVGEEIDRLNIKAESLSSRISTAKTTLASLKSKIAETPIVKALEQAPGTTPSPTPVPEAPAQ